MASNAPYIASRRLTAQAPSLDWVRLGAWAGAVVFSIAAWAAIVIAILSLAA
jgi:hypothetical protein